MEEISEMTDLSLKEIQELSKKQHKRNVLGI